MIDQPQLNIDFQAITGLFDEAHRQGRDGGPRTPSLDAERQIPVDDLIALLAFALPGAYF